MRVALVGKGGSGKSTLAGTLCRLLADAGERVVAFDGDEVPGLGQVLGAELGDEWLLAGAAVRDGEGAGWNLTMSPEEVVARHAVEVRPGLRLVQSGKLGADEVTETERSSFVAFHQTVGAFDDDSGWVVADLPAGTVHAYGGWIGTAGVVLAVVQPSLKSTMTARRLAALTRARSGLVLAGVANNVATEAERRWVVDELADAGIPVWAVVPADPAVTAAEHAGEPLVALDDGCAFVRATAQLVERLRKEQHR